MTWAVALPLTSSPCFDNLLLTISLTTCHWQALMTWAVASTWTSSTLPWTVALTSVTWIVVLTVAMTWTEALTSHDLDSNLDNLPLTSSHDLDSSLDKCHGQVAPYLGQVGQVLTTCHRQAPMTWTVALTSSHGLGSSLDSSLPE